MARRLTYTCCKCGHRNRLGQPIELESGWAAAACEACDYPNRLGPDARNWITLAGLKPRGWTGGMVSSLLGEPDKMGENRHYKRGGDVGLYLILRVEQAESGAEFKERSAKAMAQRGKRSASAQAAAETKKLAAIDTAEFLAAHIEIPQMPVAELTAVACAHWNARREDWDGEWPQMPAHPKKSDGAFLARISVNFLRHADAYDDLNGMARGRVGVADAYIKRRNILLSRIAGIYPHLRKECAAQKLAEAA